MLSPRRFIALLCVLALASAAPSASASVWQDVAREHGLDPLLLYAVALKESRKLWGDGRVRPWPWALHARRLGGGRLFDSREEALAHLEALTGADAKANVDVGLLQVNWRWHREAVATPADLLDPQTNLRVGAAILRRAIAASDGDIRLGLARYHNRRLAKGLPYADDVLAIVEGLRRHAVDHHLKD
jgi:hypothetical protein